MLANYSYNYGLRSSHFNLKKIYTPLFLPFRWTAGICYSRWASFVEHPFSCSVPSTQQTDSGSYPRPPSPSWSPYSRPSAGLRASPVLCEPRRWPREESDGVLRLRNHFTVKRCRSGSSPAVESARIRPPGPRASSPGPSEWTCFWGPRHRGRLGGQIDSWWAPWDQSRGGWSWSRRIKFPIRVAII